MSGSERHSRYLDCRHSFAGAVMSRMKFQPTVGLFLVAALLAACGEAGSAGAPQGRGAGLDRCTLLTDEEVSEAIGAHDGGSSFDVERPGSGAEGCRWRAASSREIEGYGTWLDLVEVAVFDKAAESLYRDRAEGEPVEGLDDGALYNESTGELWFSCGDGRFCAVKARTAKADGREQLARRLAIIVREGMKARSR
jgi:hypothetical protein